MILANSNLNAGSDGTYYWRVLATDGQQNSSWSEVRYFGYGSYTITFNLTSVTATGTTEKIFTSGTGCSSSAAQCSFDITCSNGFSETNAENELTATDAFILGIHSCNITEATGTIGSSGTKQDQFFDREIQITTTADAVITVEMDHVGGLTAQEHDWLESLYDCLVSGTDTSCTAIAQLNEINKTTNNVWNQFRRTDEFVVLSENITNRQLDSNNNITVDYAIKVPEKEGYATGDFLPIRVAFWFLDDANETCFSQDKLASNNRAENPFCIPLIAQTGGKIGDTVTFTAALAPDLPDGTYNIVRNIEIDPPVDGKPVWINYGREMIGQIRVMESLGTPFIRLHEAPRLAASSPTASAIAPTIQAAVALTPWWVKIILLLLGMVVMLLLVIGMYLRKLASWK